MAAFRVGGVSGFRGDDLDAESSTNFNPFIGF